jgi:hypothetical protein
MDPTKVDAVDAWLPPWSLWVLRAFLGLTRYYRKFIMGYDAVAAPFMTLLKREAFKWTDKEEEVFQHLEQALMMTPLLQMPDFDKRFIIDCDSSGMGFGVMLHQGDSAIAYFSYLVAQHHQKLPSYENNLIILIKVVHHWQPYIWDRAFTIHTDHYSLKFLLG